MENATPLSASKIKPAMVSVLVPCHQHGHFLPQALESILRQTYRLFEIILVNDGSTDNTHQIGMDYADRYPDRFIYLQQECQGQSIARRNASALASGEFWITLDADDVLEANMVEKSVQALQANPQAAVVVSDVWIVDASGKRVLDRLKQNTVPAWPDILNHNPLGGIAGIMLRAEAIEKVGGLAHEGLPGAEDWDLWIRLVRSRLSFLYIPECLARYRQTPNSHSRQPLDVLLGTLQVLERLKQDDPRLAQVCDPYPPIDSLFYQGLRNRIVFFTYGIALASNAEAETIRQILSHLLPSSLEIKICAQSLVGGVNKILAQKAIDADQSLYVRSLQFLKDYLIAGTIDSVLPELREAIESEQSRRRQVYQRWDRLWRKRWNNALWTVELRLRDRL